MLKKEEGAATVLRRRSNSIQDLPTLFKQSPNRKKTFEDNRAKILEPITPGINPAQLGKILKLLDPDDYSAVIEHLNTQRKNGNSIPVNAGFIMSVFKRLETREQAVALCRCTNFQILEIKAEIPRGKFQKLADAVNQATPDIAHAVFTEVQSQAKTEDERDYVNDRLSEYDSARLNKTGRESPPVAASTGAEPEVAELMLTGDYRPQQSGAGAEASPAISEKKEKIQKFLAVYYSLLSMASFPSLRSNKWGTLPKETPDTAVGKTWDLINTHAKTRPQSRTARALGLVTANPLGLNENDLVLETIKEGFRKAPFYASVEVDGQTFFRHASLVKYLKTRKEGSDLQGKTVEAVRRTLGLR